MKIRPANAKDLNPWASMRVSLWPETPLKESLEEVSAILSLKPLGNEEVTAGFILCDRERQAAGFIEVALYRQHPYYRESPIGFIEGWYITPPYRGLGGGRLLMDAAAQWALERSCRILGSDTEIWRTDSQQIHLHLGFEIIDRNDEVMYFRKTL